MLYFLNYCHDFLRSLMTLSFHDKFIIAIYVIILLFYFFRLLIQKPKLRLIFFMFFKKCIFITILSLVIYMVSDQSLCDTPVTKTLFEKFFENKKLGTFLIFSGVTIGTSIYIYKKCYPIVDPFLEIIKKKETFLELEHNHNKLASLYAKYLKNQDLNSENGFLVILPGKLKTYNITHDLTFLTPTFLEEMREKNLKVFNDDLILVKNLKNLDSKILDFDDIKALNKFQEVLYLNLKLLNSTTVANNHLLGWYGDNSLIESLQIIQTQAYFFEDINKYNIFLKGINCEIPISIIFNHVIHKSEDLLIVSGYAFFTITSIFTYSGNPIPYEFFLQSFYRLFK